jgi:nucleotide-binding universal stress UspA family protein
MVDPRPRRLGRILCPTDLSRASGSAVDLAVHLARVQRAEIVVLHAREGGRAGAHVEITRLVTGARRRGVKAEGVIQGDTIGCILECAGAWPADLLVMGTHDDRQEQDCALGSVTERVLRRSPCPVLVTASSVRLEAIANPRRILCPSDFSDASRTALEYGIVLARGFGARITLLHVLEWFPGDEDVEHLHIPEYHMDVAQEAADRLERSVPEAARALCAGQAIVAVGRPHRAILRVARERQADLIVLGIHRRRTLDRLLGGSTLSRVVRETLCPVLAVPIGPSEEVASEARIVAHERAS